MKNQVERMCISCRKLKNRDELIKITLMKDDIYINGNSRIFGRSVYVCKCLDCLNLFLKKKGIKRGLKLSCDALIKKGEKLIEIEVNELKKEKHPADKLH